jgi:hypothetical protein
VRRERAPTPHRRSARGAPSSCSAPATQGRPPPARARATAVARAGASRGRRRLPSSANGTIQRPPCWMPSSPIGVSRSQSVRRSTKHRSIVWPSSVAIDPRFLEELAERRSPLFPAYPP